MSLFTFGYEGLSIETFIARLKAAGVKVVIDVRELPLSRKKGFSKTSFCAALDAHGIAYAHLPAFGCPLPIRDRYKNDGDWSRYEKAFTAYLSTLDVAIAELARFSDQVNACLVCYEADFNFCHRSLVAQAVSDASGAKIVHLTATKADSIPLIAA